MSVLAISKQFECRPSQLFPEMDEYTAFCFDEACTYITVKLQDKEAKPHFKQNDDEKPVQKFKSASDLYKSMGYGNNQYKKQI